MAGLYAFVEANLWLCLGAGVVILIVADEVFGLSRALFGTPPEDRPPDPPRAQRPVETEEGPKVEDFLPPRR